MSDAEEKNIEVNLITYNAAISACCLVENHVETWGTWISHDQSELRTSRIDYRKNGSMARGRGAGEEALQLFDDVKSMAMELDAAWQMFIVPMSAFSQRYIRRVTSQKDKKAQTGKHEI